MKKHVGLRLEEQTIKNIKDIVEYENDHNSAEMTSASLYRKIIVKYVKEYDLESKIKGLEK